MTDREPRRDAYLRELPLGKDVIAGAVRESRTTPCRAPVVPTLRWWIALTALALLAACGSGSHEDTYARGIHVQEDCCEQLASPHREACLREVVRVDDPGAARTATNQQTFACVVDHFVCDPTTGRETRESAQAQHDCIADLQ